MGIPDHDSPVQDPETKNKNTIKSLYKGLAQGNSDMVAQLLAAELEWWYHGPPNHHHMMLVLTGKPKHTDQFKFRPRSITNVGDLTDLVIVEGWDEMNAYWVHVWTVRDGKITQFREYFNTWLTVLLQVPADEAREENMKLWQSEPRQRQVNRSLPDLLLTV